MRGFVGPLARGHDGCCFSRFRPDLAPQSNKEAGPLARPVQFLPPAPTCCCATPPPAGSKSTTSPTTTSPMPVRGFGNFSSLGETDMIMRNANNGGVEVYGIRNNAIIGTNFMAGGHIALPRP